MLHRSNRNAEKLNVAEGKTVAFLVLDCLLPFVIIKYYRGTVPSWLVCAIHVLFGFCFFFLYSLSFACLFSTTVNITTKTVHTAHCYSLLFSREWNRIMKLTLETVELMLKRSSVFVSAHGTSSTAAITFIIVRSIVTVDVLFLVLSFALSSSRASIMSIRIKQVACHVFTMPWFSPIIVLIIFILCLLHLALFVCAWIWVEAVFLYHYLVWFAFLTALVPVDRSQFERRKFCDILYRLKGIFARSQFLSPSLTPPQIYIHCITHLFFW